MNDSVCLCEPTPEALAASRKMLALFAKYDYRTRARALAMVVGVVCSGGRCMFRVGDDTSRQLSEEAFKILCRHNSDQQVGIVSVLVMGVGLDSIGSLTKEEAS